MGTVELSGKANEKPEGCLDELVFHAQGEAILLFASCNRKLDELWLNEPFGCSATLPSYLPTLVSLDNYFKIIQIPLPWFFEKQLQRGCLRKTRQSHFEHINTTDFVKRPQFVN